MEKYYQEFEGGNYQYDVNQARVEALDYVMDYRQRLGISVSSYFRVSGEKYVQLKKTYKNLMCLPATSSSVERSFSVHGCFLTSRRMKLSLKTMAYLMLIRMNYVLAERQGWEKELQQYSSDRFLLEVTEITRPPLIIIDYSHFSCMSGNHIGTLFGIRNTLNSSLIRRYQY